MYIIHEADKSEPLYVQVREGLQLILQPELKEATKFEDTQYDEASYILDKVRKAFPNKGFIMNSVTPYIFGKKPRRVFNFEIPAEELNSLFC